jgi:hypothetical protein
MSGWLRDELKAAIHYRHTKQAQRHARYTGLGYGLGLAFVALMLCLAFFFGTRP